MLQALIRSVEITQTELRAEASLAEVDLPDLDNVIQAALSAFRITTAISLQRRGAELRLILQGPSAPKPKPDPKLIHHLVAARRRCADYLDPDQALSVSAMAARDGLDTRDVSRSLQLAFLAPDLVERILEGTQPLALTAEKLKRIGELPLLWQDQADLLGGGQPTQRSKFRINFIMTPNQTTGSLARHCRSEFSLVANGARTGRPAGSWRNACSGAKVSGVKS